MSKTHFEQIPVETVKKIAKELPETTETTVVQTLDEIAPRQEHWRELAKQVQEEQDSEKMTELVARLLVAFDEEHARKGSSFILKDNGSSSIVKERSSL